MERENSTLFLDEFADDSQQQDEEAENFIPILDVSFQQRSLLSLSNTTDKRRLFYDADDDDEKDDCDHLQKINSNVQTEVTDVTTPPTLAPQPLAPSARCILQTHRQPPQKRRHLLDTDKEGGGGATTTTRRKTVVRFLLSPPPSPHHHQASTSSSSSSAERNVRCQLRRLKLRSPLMTARRTFQSSVGVRQRQQITTRLADACETFQTLCRLLLLSPTFSSCTDTDELNSTKELNRLWTSTVRTYMAHFVIFAKAEDMLLKDVLCKVGIRPIWTLLVCRIFVINSEFRVVLLLKKLLLQDFSTTTSNNNTSKIDLLKTWLFELLPPPSKPYPLQQTLFGCTLKVIFDIHVDDDEQSLLDDLFALLTTFKERHFIRVGPLILQHMACFGALDPYIRANKHFFCTLSVQEWQAVIKNRDPELVQLCLEFTENRMMMLDYRELQCYSDHDYVFLANYFVKYLVEWVTGGLIRDSSGSSRSDNSTSSSRKKIYINKPNIRFYQPLFHKLCTSSLVSIESKLYILNVWMCHLVGWQQAFAHCIRDCTTAIVMSNQKMEIDWLFLLRLYLEYRLSGMGVFSFYSQLSDQNIAETDKHVQTMVESAVSSMTTTTTTTYNSDLQWLLEYSIKQRTAIPIPKSAS